MQKILNNLSNENGLRFFAVLLSIALSYLILLHQQPFNVDGILYLKAANVFQESGLKASMSVYPWPFFSILIVFTHQITGFSLEHAAFLLDTLLISFMVGIFITLIKEAGGNLKIQYWAALVILIFPYLNHARNNILRDFGYYAFALLSLVYFIRYLQQSRYKDAILWNISIIIAALFRIEGIILFCLAPFLILYKIPTSHLPSKQSLKNYFILNIPLIILSAFLILWLLSKHTLSINNSGRLSELFFFFHHDLFQIINHIETKSSIIGSSVLTIFSQDLSSIFLFAGLFSLLLFTFINTLSFLYTLLSYYGFKNKLLSTDKNSHEAILTYIVINLLIVTTFLLKSFFLEDRYILLLSLLCLLAVPFTLDFIFTSWKNRTQNFAGKKWVFPLVCLGLVILAISGLGHFGPSKAYIINAGNWLNENTPTETRVYSNDEQLSYYSHRAGSDYHDEFHNSLDPLTSLTQTNLNAFDYAAIVVLQSQKNELPEILKLLQLTPMKTFKNPRGDMAIIFRLVRPSNSLS
jgi:hypothetical protein